MVRRVKRLDAIGLSLKLAPQKRASAKNGGGKASGGAADFLVRAIRGFTPSLLSLAERSYATHRTIGDVEATRGFHPVAFGAPSTSSRLRASAKLNSIS